MRKPRTMFRGRSIYTQGVPLKVLKDNIAVSTQEIAIWQEALETRQRERQAYDLWLKEQKQGKEADDPILGSPATPLIVPSTAPSVESKPASAPAAYPVVPWTRPLSAYQKAMKRVWG